MAFCGTAALGFILLACSLNVFFFSAVGHVGFVLSLIIQVLICSG